MTKKNLRTGFSTGSAASAAARAALTAILSEEAPQSVQISLPQGGQLKINIHHIQVLSPQSASATVIKDAGDDPDVTNKAAITAQVTLLENNEQGENIVLTGGTGVGTVTRPGLPVTVGRPAINPVPREMIIKSLRQVWAGCCPGAGPLKVKVEISIKNGQRLAQKTLNPRLGIVGGLSILGTTGLVKPFSHEAYTATIDSGLSVARAMGLTEVVLTTGGKSEKKAMSMRPDLPEPAFIQIADYFGYSLRKLQEHNFFQAGLVSFFGKAVKQAQGLEYTHAHKGALDLGRLVGWLAEAQAAPDLVQAVARANTARHALTMIKENNALHLLTAVGDRLLASARSFAGPQISLWVKIIDFDGSILYQG